MHSMMRSHSKSLSLKSKIATWIKARYIQFYRIRIVDFFGSTDQIITSVKPSMKTIELMCHPMYNTKKEIIDKERGYVADDCTLLKNELFPLKDIPLIKHNQLLHL